MGATLGVIPVRRQNLNDGTYFHKDDVIAVLDGYAAQLAETWRGEEGGHYVGIEALMQEVRGHTRRWAADEFKRMADYFKKLDGIG